MDLELDEDQAELRDHARASLEGLCPPAVVRAVFEGSGAPRGLWESLVGLGWTSLAAPQRVGGLGMGEVARAVLASEVGYAVAPVPYLSTVTQFAPLLDRAGADDLLSRVVGGTTTGALALGESGGYRPCDITATATPDGRGWRIDGLKPMVPDAAAADMVAVVARLTGSSGTSGLGAFLVHRDDPGVAVEPVVSIDPSTPVADLSLTATRIGADRVLLDPRDPRSGVEVEGVRRHATAMLAVSCVATCRAIFETTLEYSKTRHQFGRPIGGFQAVKARLADLYLAVERADALGWYAVVCLAEAGEHDRQEDGEQDRQEDGETARAVSMAKAAAGECRRLATRDGLQLHGAIGFIWENDLHFWLKRAMSTSLLYGDVEAHRGELAQLLGLVGDGPGCPREVARR